MVPKKEREGGLELLVDFTKRGGYVPTVVQDYKTKDILMIGYANSKALEETLRTGYATLWSTSRNELWMKGYPDEEDLLPVKEILVDCDQDALIYMVEASGKRVCHTKKENGENRRTCFYRKIVDGKLQFVEMR